MQEVDSGSVRQVQRSGVGLHTQVAVQGRGIGLFDPSGTAIPMGFVRFGTGRDAADVAFATIFGTVTSRAPVISIQAVPGADGRLVVPHHRAEAISTDG